MHKWGILVIGLCVGGVLFSALVRQAAAEAPGENIPDTLQPMDLPCRVRDTNMVIRAIAAYEGPFWEDGSGEEAADILALVVENIGGTMILQGEILLRTERGELRFCVSWLPPDSVVLIPEQGKASAGEIQILDCGGWHTTIYPEMTGAVTAREQGMGELVFTNHTTQPIAQVEAWYRSYDAQSGMYIGGCAQTVVVEGLQPEEERVISPYRYAKGYSKVVSILLDTSE